MPSARDVIWDFNPGEGDKIDVHLIDAITGGKDQAFTLVSAFTKSAGQLSSALQGDHYVVQGDVNGDGIADFALDVYSPTPIFSNNFIL